MKKKIEEVICLLIVRLIYPTLTIDTILYILYRTGTTYILYYYYNSVITVFLVFISIWYYII